MLLLPREARPISRTGISRLFGLPPPRRKAALTSLDLTSLDSYTQYRELHTFGCAVRIKLDALVSMQINQYDRENDPLDLIMPLATDQRSHLQTCKRCPEPGG